MLEDDSYSEIVTWGYTGESFVVKEPNEFAKNILPKHFKHSNFASFVRQLNKYDFHKVRNADDGNRPYGDQVTYGIQWLMNVRLSQNLTFCRIGMGVSTSQVSI